MNITILSSNTSEEVLDGINLGRLFVAWQENKGKVAAFGNQFARVGGLDSFVNGVVLTVGRTLILIKQIN